MSGSDTQRYFASLFFESLLIINSRSGTAINIIQGTNEIVNRNVLWYNGSIDNCLPKRKRNRVIEGYITIQIFREAISFSFVFMPVTFSVFYLYAKVDQAGGGMVGQR